MCDSLFLIVRQHPFPVQMTKLGLMGGSDTRHQPGPPGQKMHLHSTPVIAAGATLHQSGFFTAPYQRHGAVVFGLQPLSQLTHARPIPTAKTLEM